MAFKPHRIVSKTVQRGKGLKPGFDVVVPRFVSESGEFPDPELEGEMIVQIVENSQIANLYVTVNFDTGLDWAPVSVTEDGTIDNRTGQTWNHLGGFFR